MRRLSLAVLLISSLAATLTAQPARLRNARLQSREAGADPQATVSRLVAAQREPGFIAYAVPADGARGLCCFDHRDQGEPRVRSRGCRLEGERSFTSTENDEGTGSDHIVVFIRAEDGRATNVRMYSGGCALDAGDRPVQWLSELTEAGSVAVLTPLAGSDVRRVSEGSLHALSAHDGRPSVDALIELAKAHDSSHTRGQALFWLAQRAGEQARNAITEAIEEDPETEVKKKAVFALSQLPRDEGVPLLIRTASKNKNAAVRRQAMFWLGQSRDPRALIFFEEVLNRD
jgi:hypothetical protein